MPKKSEKQVKKTEKIKKSPDATPQNATSTTPPSEKTSKRGAKSQYANKVKPYLADIARYTRCGVTEGQLCEYYGVGATQWAEYKKKYPELTETLLNARQELKTNLENRAFKVAMGYDYEETTTVVFKDPDGKITGSKTTTYKRHAKADAGMLQFLLINRNPDEYARDPQTVALRKKALELQEQGKLPFDGEGV